MIRLLPVFLACTVCAQEQFVRTAADRAGLHHIRVSGRFVDTKGQPVSGVRVTVGALPLLLPGAAELLTGADGRFQFDDISTALSVDLVWFPPERWKRGQMPLRAGIGEEVRAGDIRLEESTVVRAAVEFVGGAAMTHDRVSIQITNPKQPQRINGIRTGSYFGFREISFDEGTIELSAYDGNKPETYSAPVRIARGSNEQIFYLRAKRDTVKQLGEWQRRGEMEVYPMFAPIEGAKGETRVNGKLVDPDGEPVAGAVVMLTLGVPSTDPAPTQVIKTGRDGLFEFRHTSPNCRSAIVSIHSVNGVSADLWSIDGIDQTAKLTCEQIWNEPRTLRLTKARKVEIQIDGVPANAPWWASWWNPLIGWIDLGGLRAWAPQITYGEALYKLDAPGRMPLIVAASNPGTGPVSAQFRSAPGTRTLRVTAGGKPLRGARVDLEFIRDIQTNERVGIGMYAVNEAGSLQLEGGADQLIEAFVFADGYDPARAIWTAGVPLQLDLKRRDAKLRFPDLRRGDIAFVTTIGTRSRRSTTAAEITVAAGAYDVLVVGARGELKGHGSAVVKAEQTTEVRASSEALPRVLLSHPTGCRVRVSRGTADIMPIQLLANTNGPPPRIEPWAWIESATSTQTILGAPGPGWYRINVTECGLTGTWWREVRLSAGAPPVVLTLPVGRASLKGSMRAFPESINVSATGADGPRMQLIASDPEGWSVTIPFPDREGPAGFRLSSLPEGTFHVMQHLIGEERSREIGGRTYKDVEPIHAWGGITVRLESGKTSELRDFMDYPRGPLAVIVEDETGAPLEGATLRVRDRMSSSGAALAIARTGLDILRHAIPPPAAARIVAGRTELPLVRRGLLELDIERDDGLITPFRVMLREGEPLRLRMPKAGGAR